jgi:hypothetical protein
MRTVGHRQEQRISFNASGALLAEGARFNDEIHRLPTGARTYMRKGVFRFRTHEEANRHDLDCIVDLLVQISSGRLRRRSGVRPPDGPAGP